ncbi:hypothetical protein ASG35_25725 [Burkholderia sp. Leaf177]|nr:hypothetical protein ASG35_25725 [Burkholderia sp. Leaf177]
MFARTGRVANAQAARQEIPADGFAEFPRRQKITTSLFLSVATVGFMAIAAGAVFQSVLPHTSLSDACVAALVVTIGLGGIALRRERRRPVAFEIGQDGLTTWDREGRAHYRQISGCAQWSDRLLALILVSADGRSEPLLVPADALATAGAFRELAVRARRCAQEHL